MSRREYTWTYVDEADLPPAVLDAAFRKALFDLVPVRSPAPRKDAAPDPVKTTRMDRRG